MPQAHTVEELANLIRGHFYEDWSPPFMSSQALWILRHVFKKGDWLSSNIMSRSHDTSTSPMRTWFFTDPAYPLDVWLIRHNPDTLRYHFRRVL